MKLVLSLMRKESCEELATLKSGRADEIVECISKVADVVGDVALGDTAVR